MSNSVIKLFNNSDGNHSSEQPTLNYFESTVQHILEEIQTTEGLILWSFVVLAIGFGFMLNLLVLRSILRLKCNGK